jgi:glycosyltransferase involved in cell wall biosynthesis
LLFPSDVETFGNVTLEALGSGIPAVVEEDCSRHLVSDGIEGFTVHQGISDPNDKVAYQACVQRYLTKTRRLVVDRKLRAEVTQPHTTCYLLPLPPLVLSRICRET